MAKKPGKQMLAKIEAARIKLIEEAEKWNRRQEKKLWQEMTSPCTLADTLIRLTRPDLDSIRQTLALTGLSALKKGELINELVKAIPPIAAEIFFRFDDIKYVEFKTVASRGGILYDIPEDFDIGYWRDKGLIFPCLVNGRRALQIPVEILQVFREVDGAALRKQVEENTQLAGLIGGLVFYYGYVSLPTLAELLKEYTGRHYELPELVEVLSVFHEEHDTIEFREFGICDFRVDDTDHLIREQRSRSDLPHYKFSKEQLLLAGSPYHIEWTPQLKEFAEVLQEGYDLELEDVEDIVEEIWIIINNDGMPSDVLEFFQDNFELPTIDFAKRIAAKLMDVFNHTRMWVLKGHMPAELCSVRDVEGLSTFTTVQDKFSPKVVSITTGKAVGRNDPCPCCSGKKFKKCCGKS